MTSRQEWQDAIVWGGVKVQQVAKRASECAVAATRLDGAAVPCCKTLKRKCGQLTTRSYRGLPAPVDAHRAC
jgi:hypothetical protein